MLYTNHSGLPLSIGVWLAHDDYDYDDRSNHISATSLLKPLKQFILSNRVENDERKEDIVGRIPSSMGSSIHNGIEAAWKEHYRTNMEKLGYPQKVIDRVAINPTEEFLKENPRCIPVYLEVRAEREVDGFIVSGKFDFIGDGRVEDFKTTSVYTYMNRTNDDKYIMQGSIYRWLNPDKIKRSDMAIQFIFTDWQGSRTREPNYPNQRTLEHKLLLKPVEETESFIRNQIALIKRFKDVPEDELPECSDEDLWRSETIFKVYKDDKARRAVSGGGRFTDKREAERFVRQKGSGVIKTFPGEVKACRFCKAMDICSQAQRYLASGELTLRG